MPGDVFDDSSNSELTSDAMRRIGQILGRLCRALSSFDHPHAEHFMAWDISNGLVSSDALWSYAQPDLIELAGSAQEHLAASPFTTDSSRRRQVIHNDAHRGNILRTPGTADVCGLIDFGDMLVAPLANELAIPAVSFVTAQPDLLDVLTPLIAGFHASYPLESIDVAVLHDSITARAVLTGLLFDFQLAECPDMHEEIAASRPYAMNDLATWLTQDPNKFHEHIATALDIT